MIISAAVSTIVNSTGRFIKDSIDEGFFLLSQVGYTENKKFSWLRYWPSYLSGAIAIASTVAAIAMKSLGNPGMAIFHSAVAIGSAFLAGTLHVFIPLKKLEEQTTLYQQQNTALHLQNESLQKTKELLQLDTQNLATELNRRAEEHRNLTGEMNGHLERLGTLTSQLLASEEKQKGLEEMLAAIGAASNSFHEHSARMSDLERNLAEKGHAIIEATHDLSHVTQTLSTQLSELKKQHTSAAAEYQEALSFSDNLSRIFTSMQEIYHKTQIEEQRMKEQLEAMQKTSSTITHSTATFSQSIEALQQALTKAEKQAAIDFPN